MLVFLHPRVLSRVAGFPVASPCLWGKLENLSFSNVSKQVVMLFCVADVALSDIPTCLMMFTKFQNWRKSRRKCWFFLHPRVLSRVCRFPVASPCLWGKLENMSFSNVSKQVVMLFCVADVALSDIPTCLMMFTKFQNWRKSRRKCWFFLHPRVLSRVCRFPVASPCLWGKLENMSFCVAGVALCDIPNLFDNVLKISQLEEVSHETIVFLHPRVSSRVSGFPVASPCLWGKLRTPHSTLHAPQFYTLKL